MRRVVLVIALLSGCGGELANPGAKGKISILEGPSIEEMTTVEIRLMKNDGSQLEVADIAKDSDVAVKRFALESLPTTYEIEYEDGPTDEQKWRAVVWLSRVEKEDAPVVGDLMGSEPFTLEDCTQPLGDEQYCETTEHVDVQINAQIVGG